MEFLTQLIELIGFGIVLGSIISLGAIGLTLIYGIARFANFTQGDFMSLGAYVALLLVVQTLPGLGIQDTPIGVLSFGWVMLASFIPAALVTGLVAVVFHRFVYRKLQDRGVGAVLLAIASLAVTFIIRSLIFILWGPDFHFYRAGLRPMMDLPLGLKLRPDQIFIIVTVAALVIALRIFLQRTKMGKALRAMADNPDLARITGIPTERMTVAVWMIGGAMAAVAGILLGIDSQLRPEMGWLLLLPMFAAVILGTIGNPYGALVGGLIIGITQQVSTLWLLPTYKPAVAFGVMIIVLLVRPSGIFGEE